jgi:hypothetical protein
MAYNIKGGKLARNKPTIGEKILIDYARHDGQWYWRESTRNNHETWYGPFGTEQEAEKHSEITVLGPQCKVKNGGVWDPAWDKLQ